MNRFRSAARCAAVIVASAAIGVSAQASRTQKPSGPPTEMRVFKQVGCGCCELWARHMRAAGFAVTMTEATDLDRVKREHGVPASMASCHTGRIGGYAIEGHIPADVVKRLLAEQPAVKGIAVPGMPIGSPGMEQGDRKDPYAVLTFDAAGKGAVYARR